MQTSPLVAWRRTLAPPRLVAPPPPPSWGGGGSRAVIQQPRRSSTPPPAHPSSPSSAPPPLPGSLALYEGYCRSSPPPPASPASGVAGRDDRLAGHHHLPGSQPIHTPAPSWASIVRDGARANHTAVSRHDFLTLYERCIDSGLRTRLILATRLVVMRFPSPAA